MTTLDDTIRQAIEAYLARSPLSERKLGAFAVGDPGLIVRLKAGGSMTLDTADGLLRYMDEAPIGPAFRSEVEAFLSETGIAESKFGSAAAGSPSFVAKLRGGASPRLSTVERVQAWMRANRSELIRAFAERRQRERRAASAAPASDRAPRDTPAAATARRRSSAEDALERTTPAPEDSTMFLSTREAAALLALSHRTLDRWRRDGGGPPYIRLGSAVRYPHADLVEWAWERRREGTPVRPR